MIRFLISILVHLVAHAVGLLVAAWVLADMTIEAAPFVMAVLIFTGVEVVAGPLIVKIARRNAPALLGAIALVTTFVGLLVADLVSDGLDIEGISTWLAATVIVWLAALIAGFVLPILLVKMGIDHRRERTSDAPAGRTYSP